MEREATLTLYEKVGDYLAEGIREGLFPPGTQIESESDLMKRFGFSRVTVRNAISRLVQEGLLIPRQGKGTFVASPRLEYRLGELYGTPELVASQGLMPRMKVLNHAFVQPDPDVRVALQLGDGGKVLRIERQDLAGDIPVAFAVIHLPEWLGRQFEPDEFTREPLYRLLWRKTGIFVDRAHQTLRAMKADFHVTTLLSIPLGDPIILGQRTTYASDGRPVESATAYYRSEVLYFSVQLKRSRPGQDLEPVVSLRAQLNTSVLDR